MVVKLLQGNLKEQKTSINWTGIAKISVVDYNNC